MSEMTPDPTSGLPVEDPVVDAKRLAEIADLDLLSGATRERLDEFARRAAESLGLPIGLVSIVLDTAQHFAGMHGVGGWIGENAGTPVEWSFCANAVRSRQPYVVPDAATDSRQRDNPLVTVDGIGCYAGMPLETSRGFVIGTLCVIGGTPRTFTDEELAALRVMAEQVVAEVEANRISTRAA